MDRDRITTHPFRMSSLFPCSNDRVCSRVLMGHLLYCHDRPESSFVVIEFKRNSVAMYESSAPVKQARSSYVCRHGVREIDSIRFDPIRPGSDPCNLVDVFVEDGQRMCKEDRPGLSCKLVFVHLAL